MIAQPMSSRGRAVYHFVRLFSLALVLLGATGVRASVVFNWPSSPGWTAGTPGNGQTKTQSFTSVTTNDITVSIYTSGVNNQGGYPQISTNSTTGGLTGVNGLQLYISSTPTFGNFLRVTVSFATAVTNLSFQLWDVDAAAGQFVDKFANIQALAQGGGTVGATSVTSEVAGYNSITGTGLSTVILGTAGASNTTNQGTVDITFAGPITQFSFEWSNNDNGRGAQAVGLGPLTYTPVPETRGIFGGIISCIVAASCEMLLRHRSRARKRPR